MTLLRENITAIGVPTTILSTPRSASTPGKETTFRWVAVGAARLLYIWRTVSSRRQFAWYIYVIEKTVLSEDLASILAITPFVGINNVDCPSSIRLSDKTIASDVVSSNFKGSFEQLFQRKFWQLDREYLRRNLDKLSRSLFASANGVAFNLWGFSLQLGIPQISPLIKIHETCYQASSEIRK